uniref:Uncharacterized protein n=1 Tax=Cannabis sativa TaxID=3483 RepID=A0A803NHV0_CANSA
MAVTRRTSATSIASSDLPQDPMTTNLDVRVLATTGISVNLTDLANLANPTGTTNLTNTTGQVDIANSVGPNDQPLPPRVNPPLAPCTEGLANMEQPPGTTTNSGPRYYTWEIGPGIGEPHVDLGEDFELARRREVV